MIYLSLHCCFSVIHCIRVMMKIQDSLWVYCIKDWKSISCKTFCKTLLEVVYLHVGIHICLHVNWYVLCIEIYIWLSVTTILQVYFDHSWPKIINLLKNLPESWNSIVIFEKYDCIYASVCMHKDVCVKLYTRENHILLSKFFLLLTEIFTKTLDVFFYRIVMKQNN